MLRRFKEMRGATLAAVDGEIGSVREMYFDDSQWLARYLLVETGSWLFGRAVLIAPECLGTLDGQSHSIEVRLSRKQVKEAPDFDSEKPVSHQHQEALHRHYGWHPYWAVPGGFVPTLAAMPLPPASIAAETDPEPTRGDPHLRSSREVMGYSVHATDGASAGKIADFIVDDDNWHLRYLVVEAGSWLHGKEVLVATDWVEDISYFGREVFVNLTRAVIKGAPPYDKSVSIDRLYEERLHDHYQQKAYWDAVAGARAR